VHIALYSRPIQLVRLRVYFVALLNCILRSDIAKDTEDCYGYGVHEKGHGADDICGRKLTEDPNSTEVDQRVGGTDPDPRVGDAETKIEVIRNSNKAEISAVRFEYKIEDRS